MLRVDPQKREPSKLFGSKSSFSVGPVISPLCSFSSTFIPHLCSPKLHREISRKTSGRWNQYIPLQVLISAIGPTPALARSVSMSLPFTRGSAVVLAHSSCLGPGSPGDHSMCQHTSRQQISLLRE